MDPSKGLSSGLQKSLNKRDVPFRLSFSSGVSKGVEGISLPSGLATLMVHGVCGHQGEVHSGPAIHDLALLGQSSAVVWKMVSRT